jgi:hypothetical protein
LQLTETLSYQQHDLRDIAIVNLDLNGWDFSGQYLVNANFTGSTLENVNFAESDLRGMRGMSDSGAVIHNTIGSDGKVGGLNLSTLELLVVRDDDIMPRWAIPRDPISIHVLEEFRIDGGILELLFESDPWDSLISSQPGIPVKLDGILELTFTEDVQLATQASRTIKIFDWTGVDPQDQFTVKPQLGTAWDTSQLYSTGEVTLLGISSDLDADKDVDSNDLLLFLAQWTGADHPAADKTWRDGDSDGDGDVDSADLLVFLSQWTGAAEQAPAASLDAVSPTTTAVPEPSSVLVCMSLAAMLVTDRDRRRNAFRWMHVTVANGRRCSALVRSVWPIGRNRGTGG